MPPTGDFVEAPSAPAQSAAVAVLLASALISTWPTTLAESQTIPSGRSGVLFFPLTISAGATLTIETGGKLVITNVTMNAAA